MEYKYAHKKLFLNILAMVIQLFACIVLQCKSYDVDFQSGVVIVQVGNLLW